MRRAGNDPELVFSGQAIERPLIQFDHDIVTTTDDEQRLSSRSRRTDEKVRRSFDRPPQDWPA